MSDILLSILLVILFSFAISMLWPTVVGAPWLPSSMRNVHTMLELANVGPNDIVYDLGCGDGRTIVTAAREYGAKAVGIEVDPIRYIWCQILITVLGLRSRVKILYGNFFNKDLSEATLVTCYLLQETNDKLERKFEKELQAGTKVVSNAFTFSRIPQIGKEGCITCYSIPNS